MPDAEIPSALAAALSGVEGLVSAYLFGSVALERSHRESDVDIGILLDRRLHPAARERFDLRLLLSSRLRGAVGREADVVILNDAPPQLARHIMTSGRRILLADPETDHAHLRTTLSRAADLEPFLRRMRAVKLASLAR